MDFHHRRCAVAFLTELEDFFYNNDFDDVDFYQEELKIKIEKGVFLFNYHGVSQQIWYSSPITGAHHYALIDDQWLSTRNSENIWDRIHKEFDCMNESLEKAQYDCRI